MVGKTSLWATGNMCLDVNTTLVVTAIAAFNSHFNIFIKTNGSFLYPSYFVSYLIATEALSEINVDLIEPLPESRGHRYIFTICDRFTKACFAFALSDTKSDTIATYFLNHYIGIFGVPKVLITDNAPYFTSYSWTKFMSFLGIHHKLITPYHCQSNGLVERFN